MVDVFGYDHSCAEGVMRRAAVSPHWMYVGTIWAESNSRDDSRQKGDAVKEQRLDNMKIANWLTMAIKRRIQKLCEEGVLTVPSWNPVKGFQESRTMPTLSDKDFQLTFPSASETLPLRASYLKLMDEKLTDENALKEWSEIVKDHNQVFNQSGKAWDGAEDTSGPATSRGQDGQGGVKRKLDPIDETIESLSKKHKVVVVPHESGGSFVVSSDGQAWFGAGEKDSVLSSSGPPLGLVYGTFKIQQEAEQILNDKPNSFTVGFDTDQAEAMFRKSDASEQSGAMMPLRQWLAQIEKDGSDVAQLEIACHKVKPAVEKDAAGDCTMRKFEVEDKQACLFVPQPTPRKVASTKPPTWEDCGSLLELPGGELKMLQRWVLTEGHQGFQMNPEKPGVVPAEDILVQANTVAALHTK